MKYSIAIAYYIYALTIILCTGYVVFFKDASGWWFVLTAILVNNTPEYKHTEYDNKKEGDS